MLKFNGDYNYNRLNMISTGYSLWLIPEDYYFKKYSKIILRLSKKYHLYNFAPHVTLVGYLIGKERDLVKKTSLLATQINFFAIKMDSIDYENFYFRSLFFKAKKSKDLTNAYQRAVEIFGLEKTVYTPHLSLLYGDLLLTTKKEIIKSLNVPFNDIFKVGKLQLLKTEGEINKWEIVAEFRISET